MRRRAPLLCVALLSLTACRFDASGLTVPDGPLADGAPDRGQLDAAGDLPDGDGRLDAPADLAGDRPMVEAGPDAADLGPDAGPPLTKLAADDGRLWLGINTAARVALLSWDESAKDWTSETNLPQPAGEVHWAFGQLLGSGQELGLFKVDASGKPMLQAFRFDQGAWTQVVSITGAGAKLDKRDVALAAEGASGDLLLVYSDDTARPLYVTCSGGAWSTPIQLPINDGSGGAGPDLSSGAPLWIELVVNRKSGSNEIALLFADDNDDLVGMIWDGSAWVTASAKLISANLRDHPSSSIVTQRVFDGAFERKSGDLLVAWGEEGQNGFRYCTYAGGGWSGGTQNSSAPKDGITDFVDLAENPKADRDEIAGAFVDLDGNERLGLATWDGGKWVGAKEYDSQIRNSNNQSPGDFPAAVGWVGETGEAVCVYSDDETGKLDWFHWTAADWQSGSDPSVAGKGYTESVIIGSYGAHNGLLVVLSDSASKVYSATYDGKTFSVVNKPAVLTSALSRIDALPMALSLQP